MYCSWDCEEACWFEGGWCWGIGCAHERTLYGCWIGSWVGLTRLRRCWAFGIVIAQALTKLSQLIAEISDLMLGIRIRGPGWQPTVLRNELRGMLSVGGLVQHLPVLSGPDLWYPVQIDATVSQLSEKFRRKYHRSNVPCWGQVVR